MTDIITPQLRPLVIWPDQTLRTECEHVNDIQQTQQLIADMKHTVRRHDGLGLAAPQVNDLSRVLLVRMINDSGVDNTPLDRTDGQDPFVPKEKIYTFINPEIINVNDTYTYTWKEGCLSVPGYFEHRSRPQSITVKFQHENGVYDQMEAQGLFAFVLQHELDHLDGKVFVDQLSRLKQQRVKKKIAKTLRNK